VGDVLELCVQVKLNQILEIGLLERLLRAVTWGRKIKWQVRSVVRLPFKVWVEGELEFPAKTTVGWWILSTCTIIVGSLVVRRLLSG